MKTSHIGLDLTAVCTAALILVTFNQVAPAANIAFDSADDAVYNNGWQAGDNGGSGFGPWTLFTANSNPATGGFFIGNSANNGSAPSGDINTAGESFGLYANSGDFTTAWRDFTGGPLTAGQTFSLDMDNGHIQAGGSAGFELLDSSGSESIIIRFQGGDLTYEVFDGANPFPPLPTLVPFTDGGLSIDITLGALDTYVLRINGTVSGAGTLINPDPARLRMFNSNAGSGSSNDLFFNSFAITNAPTIPEPHSLALAGLATLGFGAVAVRRQRRRK